MVRPINRVFLDIETAPNIGLFWGCGYKISIGPDNIIQERRIICVGWKAQGAREVKRLTWDKKQDDRQLLIDLMKDIEDADEVITHFGKGFDLPWLRTRILLHGLNPMPLFKIVDTKEWASKNFYFNSNKLDYIASVLGFGHKTKTEYQWWVDILMKNCRATLAKMVDYCCRDVRLLEKVWEKLHPHCSGEVHAGVVDGRARWTCPRTGTTHVALSKRRVTATGLVRYQMVNLDDGSYYSLPEKIFNEYKNKDKKRLPKIRRTPAKRHR